MSRLTRECGNAGSTSVGEREHGDLATQEVQVLLALVSGRWTRDGLNPPEVLTDRSFVDLTGRGLLLGLFGGSPLRDLDGVNEAGVCAVVGGVMMLRGAPPL